MADTVFNVNCGFFDSINQDRLYSANEMNRPYKRIITNGVFATPAGTPSTDLQVVSAGNGMSIVCKAGEGLFADKWFENPSDIAITVPANTALVPRRDSVIAQVDTTQSGRTGNIIYRTGTPGSNPQAPDIGTVDGVIEYRLANIYVAPSANAINNDAIVDLRGSSECPWITSLIYQVDTSTLFAQWQAAYQNYYDQSTTEFENYEATRKTEWEEFFSELTSDLTVSTNLIMLTSTYTSTTTVATIPINIASYDKNTDILQVYVNGLRVVEGVNYTINSAGTSITLKSSISSGQIVNFLVLKSVITGDLATVTTLIQTLDAKLSGFMEDSGWINFTLESGATSFNSSTTPGVRCIGDRVYLRGCFKGVTAIGSTICTLPPAYIPDMPHRWTTSVVANGSVTATVVMEVQTTGYIKLLARSGSFSSSAAISLATNWALD